MHCDLRIVLLHYAPIQATVEGEPEGIHVMLGSDRLATPIAEYGADLVLHGHAHAGSFEGCIGKIPVYNVAVHVTGRDFWVVRARGRARPQRGARRRSGLSLPKLKAWTATVVRISIAPVKSLGLVHPDEIELEPHGVRGNRRFWLVDADGRLFNGKRERADGAHPARVGRGHAGARARRSPTARASKATSSSARRSTP